MKALSNLLVVLIIRDGTPVVILLFGLTFTHFSRIVTRKNRNSFQILSLAWRRKAAKWLADRGTIFQVKYSKVTYMNSLNFVVYFSSISN